jgi:dihydroorotase
VNRSDFDLVIRGGRVIDPASGRDEVADVGIRSGRVAAIEPHISHGIAPFRAYPPALGTQEIDAGGCLVVPGLVDLHAHVYTGVCPLTSPADAACAPAGVTTVVSAGDAGASTIAGLRHLVVDRSLTRVLAFLHISAIGLAGWPVPEAVNADYLDADAAVRAGEAHRDLVVGIKVRMSHSMTGSNGLLPLERAGRAARELDLPVMMHIGGSQAPLADLLALLRPGDIVTHCFTGSGHGLVEGGRLIPQARPARERGVLFDVGHGFGSFDFPTAQVCATEGFWPDAISTDLHSFSAGTTMVDLPTTMTKLLHLGMPLADVLAATTVRPAEAIGRRDFGRLENGASADITLLAIQDGEVPVKDTSGNSGTAERSFTVRKTIRAGQAWNGPFTHPGLAYNAPPRAARP